MSCTKPLRAFALGFGITPQGRRSAEVGRIGSGSAKLTALNSQIEQAAARQENLDLAREVLEKGKEHLAGRARLRDFREWTSKPEELEQMEGVKH